MKLADLIYAKTGKSIDLTSLADDPVGQALVASLMALVANCDGGISAEKTLRMVALLRDRFHLTLEEASGLTNRAASDFGVGADLVRMSGA